MSLVRPLARPLVRALPHSLIKGGGFSLDAYLASLSAGFRFNVRKTDRYFQESTGPTLADDVGETIGLALSQRLWGGNTLAQIAAAQAEIITPASGPYASAPTGVTGPNGTVTIESGAVRVTSPGLASARLEVSFPATAGRYYKVTSALDSNFGIQPAAFVNATPSSLSLLASGAQALDLIVYAPATGTMSLRFYPRSSNSGNQVAGDYVEMSSFSIKHIPDNHAVQTGASTLRPVRQVEGAKFDASDDNWLMGYLAAAGNNFIQARTTVPASLGATQVVAGASGSSANRMFLGVNTSGFACGGIGSDSTSTIVGVTDLRSTEADIAITCDGSNVRLIVNGAVEYEEAQNSTPTTSIPFRIGALNNNGTAGSFYGGAVKDIAGGTDFLTLPRFNQIRAAMAANQ